MPILVVYSCFPAVIHLLLWRLMSFDISSIRPCNERDRERQTERYGDKYRETQMQIETQVEERKRERERNRGEAEVY